MTAKRKRSRHGDVLLDVTDIRKMSACIYLNNSANNWALSLQSWHCIRFNQYEVIEVACLSLYGISPSYTKKKGSKFTIKIREWDIMGHQSHVTFPTLEQLEHFACLLEWIGTEMNMLWDQNWAPAIPNEQRYSHAKRPGEDLLAHSESGRVRVLGRFCCFIGVFTPPATEVAHLQIYT